MPKDSLITKLENVEKTASASKLKKMLKHPYKYLHAILFRELIYKRKKEEKQVTAETFFDTEMHLLLPSSTDIYLTGGKTHDSEIRLARFLINHLEPGDDFVDVGAHYGYFTMLSSKIVGDQGKVLSFEASPTTYKILQKNTASVININSLNLAVSDETADLAFYEFPNLYSEYNTLDVKQFQNETWFAQYQPKKINVKSIILDDYLSIKDVKPKIIKIDVEGAELKVIKGLKHYLSQHAPLIVMEYLSNERGNSEHQAAEQQLNGLGYHSYLINDAGNLEQQENIAQYLSEKKLESDNIVFAKQ